MSESPHTVNIFSKVFLFDVIMHVRANQMKKTESKLILL